MKYLLVPVYLILPSLFGFLLDPSVGAIFLLATFLSGIRVSIIHLRQPNGWYRFAVWVAVTLTAFLLTFTLLTLQLDGNFGRDEMWLWENGVLFVVFYAVGPLSALLGVQAAKKRWPLPMT